MLATAALLIAIGELGAGYYLWLRVQSAHQQLAAREGQTAAGLQGLRPRLNALGTDLDALESRVATQLEVELQQIEETLAAVQAAQQQSPAAAIEASDIEHLLRIASDSLVLQRNIDTALAALRTADRRLADLHDPVFAATRRQLAADIVALEAVPRPDISGMAFTLGSLQREVAALPPAGRRAGAAGSDESADAGPGARASGWRAFLHDVWVALKSLVVIRRSGEQDAALMTPDARTHLQQNLQLRLESARVALLEGDDRNYHASLTAARAWLQRYYDTTAPAVAGMIGRLGELDAVNIDPELPDLSASLQALHQALERRVRPAPAQSRPAPRPDVPSGAAVAPGARPAAGAAKDGT